MHHKRYGGLWSLICLFYLSLLTGCATVAIKDELPRESPKGFIEFYQAGKERASLFKVYRVQGSEEIYEGVAPTLLAWDIAKRNAIRIARVPGDYEYIVVLVHYFDIERKYGDKRWEQKIKVKVVEGMRTLVRIDYTLLQWQAAIKLYSWNVIVANRLIPIVLNYNSLETLISALDDSDWGVRWYASEALGEMGKIANELATKRLTELSKNDPHKLVREEAKNTLEKIGKAK